MDTLEAVLNSKMLLPALAVVVLFVVSAWLNLYLRKRHFKGGRVPASPEDLKAYHAMRRWPSQLDAANEDYLTAPQVRIYNSLVLVYRVLLFSLLILVAIGFIDQFVLQ